MNTLKEIAFWWLLLDAIAVILIKPWRDHHINLLKKLNGDD